MRKENDSIFYRDLGDIGNKPGLVRVNNRVFLFEGRLESHIRKIGDVVYVEADEEYQYIGQIVQIYFAMVDWHDIPSALLIEEPIEARGQTVTIFEHNPSVVVREIAQS